MFHSEKIKGSSTFEISESVFLFTDRALSAQGHVFEGFIRSSLYGLRPCVIKYYRLNEQNIREVRILSKLSPHSNVISIIQAGIDSNSFSDCHYIVLEKCNSLNLHQCLLHRKDNFSTYDYKWRRDICMQIIAGLTHVHRNLIIHKDLKPSNILLTEDFKTIRIADFGSSQEVKSLHSKVFCENPFGTPGYRAPEGFGAAFASMRSDSFSLGALIVFILSNGNSAFGPERHKQDYNIKNGVISIPKLYVPNPNSMNHLLTMMFEMNRCCRPTTEEIGEHPCWSGEEDDCSFDYGYSEEVTDEDISAESQSESSSCSSDAETEDQLIRFFNRHMNLAGKRSIQKKLKNRSNDIEEMTSVQGLLDSDHNNPSDHENGNESARSDSRNVGTETPEQKAPNSGGDLEIIAEHNGNITSPLSHKEDESNQGSGSTSQHEAKDSDHIKHIRTDTSSGQSHGLISTGANWLYDLFASSTETFWKYLHCLLFLVKLKYEENLLNQASDSPTQHKDSDNRRHIPTNPSSERKIKTECAKFPENGASGIFPDDEDNVTKDQEATTDTAGYPTIGTIPDAGCIKRVHSEKLEGSESIRVKNQIYFNENSLEIHSLFWIGELSKICDLDNLAKSYKCIRPPIPIPLITDVRENVHIRFATSAKHEYCIDNEDQLGISVQDIYTAHYQGENFRIEPGPDCIKRNFIEMNYYIRVNGNEEQKVPIRIRNLENYEGSPDCSKSGGGDVNLYVDTSVKKHVVAQKYANRRAEIHDSSQGCQSTFSYYKSKRCVTQ